MYQIQNFKANVKLLTTNIFKYVIPDLSWLELKKAIPIFSLFFLISFVYHILRCLKITLIIKAGDCGVQVIPFIKFWLVTPAAVLFTCIYAKLARRSNRQFLICNILAIFIIFFIIFLLFLYPNKEQLGIIFRSTLGLKKINGGLLILSHWPEALFYVMSEMWSTIIISILFWGFCNEITKISEAKKFYALVALGANFAGMFSGKFMQFISINIASSWDDSIFIFMIIVIICCFIIMLIFTKLNQAEQYNTIIVEHKVSLSESIKYLFRYKYITLLFLIVITYNIVFNLADILWLDQLNQIFSSALELNNYLAQLDFLVGAFCFIIGIFVFTHVINKFGWTITAMIPPVIWLITSIILYLTLILEKSYPSINKLILILGTLQIGLGKVIKYSIFDQIKEMAFIPLSIEQQRNSKAIIDGIASRLAKSGGSIILQGLLIFGFDTITQATNIIAILIIVAIMLWSYAVTKMGKLMNYYNN